MADSLRIKRYTYRDREGWLLFGKGPDGKPRGLFADTRELAERLRSIVRAGGAQESAAISKAYLGR